MDYLDEIVGQATAKKFIATAVKKGSLYNFLLTGPKGVGKRMFGFALAKTLGCPPHSPNFMLLGPIPSKLKDKEDKIAEHARKYLPDNPVVKVEERESILIEQIRSLIAKLVLMPMQGSKRVVLILEADKMTQEAANCFLKTLEEPPLDTLFILTSSRPNYLLPTIRSRCQVVLFSYMSGQQIKNVLLDAQDSFMLGSPGEILRLRESDNLGRVVEIFKTAPLDNAVAASIAREFEHKNLSEFFYHLLLMYRLAFYHALNMTEGQDVEKEIIGKASTVPVADLFNTLSMLNESINQLDQNPNRLLHLINVLLKLT